MTTTSPEEKKKNLLALLDKYDEELDVKYTDFVGLDKSGVKQAIENLKSTDPFTQIKGLGYIFDNSAYAAGTDYKDIKVFKTKATSGGIPKSILDSVKSTDKIPTHVTIVKPLDQFNSLLFTSLDVLKELKKKVDVSSVADEKTQFTDALSSFCTTQETKELTGDLKNVGLDFNDLLSGSNTGSGTTVTTLDDTDALKLIKAIMNLRLSLWNDYGFGNGKSTKKIDSDLSRKSDYTKDWTNSTGNITGSSFVSSNATTSITNSSAENTTNLFINSSGTTASHGTETMTYSNTTFWGSNNYTPLVTMLAGYNSTTTVDSVIQNDLSGTVRDSLKFIKGKVEVSSLVTIEYGIKISKKEDYETWITSGKPSAFLSKLQTVADAIDGLKMNALKSVSSTSKMKYKSLEHETATKVLEELISIATKRTEFK